MGQATAFASPCTLSAIFVVSPDVPAAQAVSHCSMVEPVAVAADPTTPAPAETTAAPATDTPTPTVTVTATATSDPTAPQYVAVQSVSPEMAYVIAVPVFLLSALLVVAFALVVRGGGSS